MSINYYSCYWTKIKSKLKMFTIFLRTRTSQYASTVYYWEPLTHLRVITRWFPRSEKPPSKPPKEPASSCHDAFVKFLIDCVPISHHTINNVRVACLSELHKRWYLFSARITFVRCRSIIPLNVSCFLCLGMCKPITYRCF